jgi:hypothetical protein
MDYLQRALQTFNGGDWYSWKKEDDNGNKIPNSERMQYQHIKIIKNGATMPTEAEVNAKIAELQQADADKKTKKASGKQKLLDLGLTEEEVKALIGV